jgi:hypothetical protein
MVESTVDDTIDRILDYANCTFDYADSTCYTHVSCTRDSDADDYETLCSCDVSSGVVGNMARCIPVSFHDSNCTVQDRPCESSERSCQFVVLRTLRQSPGARTTDESMWMRLEWTTITFTMDVRIEARRRMRPIRVLPCTSHCTSGAKSGLCGWCSVRLGMSGRFAKVPFLSSLAHSATTGLSVPRTARFAEMR